MMRAVCRKRFKDVKGNWNYRMEVTGATNYIEAKTIVEKAFNPEENQRSYTNEIAKMFSLKDFEFKAAKVEFIELRGGELFAYVHNPSMFFTVVKDAAADEFNIYGVFHINGNVVDKYFDARIATLNE